MALTASSHTSELFFVESSAVTDIPIEVITSPGEFFPTIKSQKELEDESAKRRKEEKMRLKLNRKKMFSKKGR